MLRTIAMATVALFSTFAWGQAQVDPADVQRVLTNAVTEVIRPAYARFAQAAGTMRETLDDHCRGPDTESLETSRRAFSQLVGFWGRVEYLRFGPVMQESRLERILFWPDRRGIGLRQVQALLAEKDDSATSRQSLSEKSVAVQGLTALEFLLFGTGSDNLMSPGSYRCSYASAIAANVAFIAASIDQGWRGDEPLAPLDLPGGEKGAEALNVLIGALVHGLEDIRDTRIRVVLGDTPEADRPRLALFWRSANTISMIRADIAGLAELFEGSDMASLLPEDLGGIAESISFEFGQSRDLANRIDDPVADALKTDAQRRQLVLLEIVLKSLTERLDQRYAAAIGLSAGFSYSDGD